MRNLMRAALASGALLLAFAGQAQAATTLGETFVPTSPQCSENNTWVTQYAAPSAGVITAWSFQADAAPPKLEFKVARPEGGNNYRIIGESDLKTPAPSTLNTYTDIRITVQAGDVIGFYVGTPGNCAREIPGHYGYYTSGDIPTGTTAAFNPNNVQLDISARLEADADRDGYGDETQDQCPTDATTQGPCRVECQGATVNKREGTEGDNTLLGTPAPDAIFGLGGEDSIDGVDGNDCLDGGDGDDILRGGADNDRELGGEGDDKVRGQGGKDKLKGGDGKDRLNGGEGKDTLVGGPGKDKLNGSAAKDKLKGNAGADDINAVDAKTDRVNCGGGDDKAVVDPVDRVSRNCETVREVEREDGKAVTAPRRADYPGTDGGPADKGCRPVINASYYVGATNMACSNARRVAKRAIRGNDQFPKWRCTGVGSSFGHCHGRGSRSGKKAHWAVND